MQLVNHFNMGAINRIVLKSSQGLRALRILDGAGSPREARMCVVEFQV